MGLTVHFDFATPAGCTKPEAEKLVESLRQLALRFQREGLVDAVRSITSDAKLLRRFATKWISLPVPGRLNAFTNMEVLPESGFLFPVEVGDDCEPLWLGLCRYPARVLHLGQLHPTKAGRGWRFSGFSKTQYASLHGWEHFQRCHCAVVELLAACRSPGLRVTISDEGDYWPRRSLARLRANLGEMNGLVAAAAGAMKDADVAKPGESPVESPIFAHPQFERLEAEGAARLAVRKK